MDLSGVQFFLDPTVLLAGLICLLVGWFVWGSSQSRRLPPGPKPWPIVGNLPYMAASKKYLFETLLDLHDQYGDIVRLKMGPTNNVVSVRGQERMHKALIEMGDTFKYRPRNFFATNYIFNQKGVFFGNGDNHTILRKFTLGAFRDFGVGRKGLEERIQDEATIMVETMKKDAGKPMNYRTLYKKAVNNIIANIVYGTRFEYDDPQSQKLVDDIDMFFKTLSLGLPENSLPFLRHLPGSKLQKVFDVFKNLEAYAKSQIEAHRQTYDPDNIRDFVDIFIQNEASDSEAINEDALFRVIVDLFNAGTDTTATTFVWAIAHIFRQPHIQDKCRKEIMEVVGPGRMISLQDKKDLPYLRALVNETLRYGAIAPITAPHTVFQDTEFEGYVIPKDSIVLFHLFDQMNDKKVWGDPECFRPERFLSESGKSLEASENFSPFSIGPRSCVGKQLANSELFLFIGTLIQRFEFKTPAGQEPPSLKRIQTGITVQPAEYEFCAISLDA